MHVNPPPPQQQPGFGAPAPMAGQPMGTGHWSAAGLGPMPVAPRPRRRKGFIVIGVILALFGLLLAIGGGIAMAVSRAASSIDPAARGVTPGAATFTAEKGTYEVLLTRQRGEDFREANDVRCVVTLADGSRIDIDGAAQAVSESSGNVETVGRFDAVPGPTSVSCEADGGAVSFVVDEESTVAKVGLIVLLAGVGVLVLGVGLVLLGVFWKKRLTLA